MSTKYLTVALVALCLGFCLGHMSMKPKIVSEIEYRRDTVVVTRPEVMVIRQTTTDTVRLPVIRSDTIFVRDSVLVEVPRQQAVYCGAGYKAWVSGFRPRLDSLNFERVSVRAKSDRSRWLLGIQAGVGMTQRGVQPYVGLGVCYRLF